MNISLYSFFLVLTFVILTIYIQDAYSSNIPGPVSCTYMGITGRICGETRVDAASLPDECNSLWYESVSFDDNNKVYLTNPWNEKADLLELNSTGKPVYLYVIAESAKQWTKIMETPIESATAFMCSLKEFLCDICFITGLVFGGFELNNDETTFFDTENLKTYISTIQKIQTMQIGINLRAKFIQKHYTIKNPALNWLNFSILCNFVNFYVFDCELMNGKCKDEFKETGLSPLDGDAHFTIIKAYDAFKNTGINKEILFFNFAAYGYFDFKYLCYSTYPQMCLNPQDAEDICADTRASLFAKGKFVRENGAGFIYAFADLEDSKNDCLCDRNFSGFYSLFYGYYGCDPPPACPLFDRT